DFDTNKKMNPPLRSADDRQVLRQAVIDGVIDVISTDHAPHTENEKDIEFERAAFGVIGLETMLPAALTALYGNNSADMTKIAQACSTRPARILGLDKGGIAVGRDADITIFDPNREWVVEKRGIVSKSKNSAFLGMRLRGKVMLTILNGVVAYRA
ncbi:MAG: amidohydrolase family protein, partial [Candidatus Omnitrophota bacterium]